jgi:staphylococcal nuclease domain-containing protein 1
MPQEVTFRVDYVVPSINREFGTVIMGGQNVAYDVVADGWAKVREFGLHSANSLFWSPSH